MVVATCLLVLVGVVGGVIVTRPKLDHPDVWDPRVAFAVRFIEQRQGRPFEHPVHVDFVPVDEFVEEVSSTTDVTDEERKAADDQEGLLRALGLIQGDIDLIQEQSTLYGSGAAAYYDHHTQRVRVRGTELGLDAKGTVVHELTHAWQDQRFDLSRLDDMDDDQQIQGFKTVVEGDAVNAEVGWKATLSEAEIEEYDRLSTQASDQAVTGMSSVPDVLVASFGAPYQFGPYFMIGLRGEGGVDEIDDALADPPELDSEVLEPWTFLDRTTDPGANAVEAPPEDGAETIDTGTFGAAFAYLVLAEQIDPHVALAASDAWAGDAYRVTREDGKVCVHLRVEAEPGGAAALEDGVGDWAAMLPHATAGGTGTGVDVDACDPGPSSAPSPVKGEPGSGRSTQVINLPVVRVAMWAVMLDSGKPADRARCIAEAGIEGMTGEEIADPSESVFSAVLDRGTAACP